MKSVPGGERTALVYLQAHSSVDVCPRESQEKGLCHKRRRRKFAESVADRRGHLHQHVLRCVCVLPLPLPPLSGGIAGSGRITFSSEGKCNQRQLAAVEMIVALRLRKCLSRERREILLLLSLRLLTTAMEQLCQHMEAESLN